MAGYKAEYDHFFNLQIYKKYIFVNYCGKLISTQ
jgi:hypothetical protein